MSGDVRGFTLLEIIISIAIFAIVAVGALGVLGATNAGGFLEGFPNAFVTGRVAKDITAAGVYLHAFQEFVAGVGSSTFDPNGSTDGTYCIGSGCAPVVALPSGLAGYPTPPAQPYELSWTMLNVVITTWYWDPTTNKYDCTTNTSACTSAGVLPFVTVEGVVEVKSTLTWQLKGATRTLTMDRFVP